MKPGWRSATNGRTAAVIYRRLRTFLREFHPANVSFRMNYRELAAFTRSIVSLGLIGRERFQYWRLLVWTSCRRPLLLPVAVKHAIYGHHFRHCADALVSDGGEAGPTP